MTFGLMSKVFAIVLGDWGSIPGWVIPKTQNMVFDTALLNTQHWLGSRVKWSNPGKGVAPSPTPRCSSYWKGSPLVALDYDRQLYYTSTLLGDFSFFHWHISFLLVNLMKFDTLDGAYSIPIWSRCSKNESQSQPITPTVTTISLSFFLFCLSSL